MAIEYCKLTANMQALVPDTDDPDDYPDHRPLTGNILFEPMLNAGQLVQHNNAGDLELLAITPITAEVKIDGRIHYEGNTWVKLPAPTIADTNIEVLQWKATFVNFRYGELAIPVNPIIFNAIPNGEIDLAAIPTVGGTPTVVIQSGPRGYGVVSARNEAGFLVFTLEGPSGEYDSDPVPLPGGVGSVTWDMIGEKPTAFTPSAHVHVVEDITDRAILIDDAEAEVLEALEPPVNLTTLFENSLI